MSTARFDKLVVLLKELFQLDRPDLDFGFYRIMHTRSADITRFLKEDLSPQVQKALSECGSGERTRLEQELRSAIEQAKALGSDPDTVPKVQELTGRLAAADESSASVEADVYDHLYRFFRRYYSKGDFISKRVYKQGVYAIPYQGEEVKLHRANADQYYIKTDEYLRSYTFRLRPNDDGDPRRVHFRVVDADEGKHGNVQPSSDKKRVFVLQADDFVAEEAGDLVIRFEYRPAMLSDWGNNSKARPPKQEPLVNLAEKRILGLTEKPLSHWIQALAAPYLLSDGSKAEYSRLRAHLTRYTARNTFDYFIHKDLGAFLRRELDSYIKNEVMHLDDIEKEDAPRVEQYLAKIKVIRGIAHKIIAFLGQLEDFQKRLWLKKKFVVETSWCVRVGSIPESFYTEIAANSRQRQEWVNICSIDEVIGDLADPGYNDPLSPDFLKAHPTLMVDTRHFPPDFTARLLEAAGTLDDQTDGVLFHSENFQALRLMQSKYRTSIHCVYIDPPYNTGGDGFVYRDNYQHSSWGAMIRQGLPLARRLATPDSAIFASIDDGEQALLRFLFDETWGTANHVANMVWAAGRKNDSRFISVSHDYILVYANDLAYLRDRKAKWWQKKKGLEAIYAHYRKLVKKYGDDYAEMTRGLKKWFKNLADSDPAKAHKHYSHVDSRGVYFPDNISWPTGRGPRYPVIHPVTEKPVAIPARGWRLTRQTMQSHLDDDRIHFGKDETTVPQKKSYLKEHEYGTPYSVFYQDGRAASNRLKGILGAESFKYPKDETVIGECINMVMPESGAVLDYFAGSGTTGHAVVNLNREDGGRRKVVLVEMGDHFDTTLLPRLKRIAYTPEWKNGKPKRQATPEEAERSPRLFKVIRLESYEDTLNNLSDGNLGRHGLWGTGTSAGFREEYLLRYMLDVETRGSPSLLDIEQFIDPIAYRLKIKVPGSDETREVAVDLLETFNWLLGLKVERLRAPRYFNARFRRNSEDRLCLDGTLEPTDDGRWWLRVVEGQLPDQRKAVIIWRNRPGGDDPKGVERDNLVLDEFFGKQGYGDGEYDLDVVYANGDHNLGNLRAGDSTWSACMVEGHFRRLMFERERLEK